MSSYRIDLLTWPDLYPILGLDISIKSSSVEVIR